MSARQRAAGLLRGLLYATAAGSIACGRATPTTAPAPSDGPASTMTPPPIAPLLPALPAIAPPAAAPAGAAAASSCLPSHDGYLRLRMRGDRNIDIDWHDADMVCDGGPRPGQQGIRLTFAGPGRRGEHSLRFVFGIAAAPGVHGARNVPTNVTVIFEGEKKLYSTAGDGKCTVDEVSEQSLAAPDRPHLQRISARGFCTAPAAALAGTSGLLLSRFDFAGIMVDDASENVDAETEHDSGSAKLPR
jgi:hypothetical protein